jgi:short-subunit dehydrogenase
VVLVTGCSSGIGFALAALLYSQKDLRVVITTRRRSIEPLQKVFPDTDRFLVRELDLQEESGIYPLVNEICCKWGRLDVLINNAAVCYRGVVEHMDVESELVQLKTNYLGPMALTRAVLPVMREQKSGHIINVSSVSGMMAMPTMASYSASKHALEGASEALWYEARPFGIRVSLMELGFVRSDSFRNVVMSKKAQVSTRLKGPHSEYYASMTPLIERLMSFSMTSPEKIARKIVALMDHPDPPLRQALTLDAIIFSLMKRFIPSRYFHKLLFHFLPGSMHWGKSLQKLRSRV